MKRIIYGSQATEDFSPEQLIELLASVRASNVRAGLSGMLLYCGRSFLQLLEGDEAALEQTYRRIEADSRHTNLRLLLDETVDERLFPDWSMGFDHVDDDELAEELPGYTPATLYPLMNPDLVTNGRVAETLLGLYARNKVR
jgi:hypothetical protein